MTEVTDTLTLTDFLLARIAEDEALARDALELYGRWHFTSDGQDVEDPYSGGVGTRPGGTDLVDWSGSAAHIARHDPSRVLAECEAKRRIVADVLVCWDDDAGVGNLVRHLASVYADHPEYRQGWRP